MKIVLKNCVLSFKKKALSGKTDMLWSTGGYTTINEDKKFAIDGLVNGLMEEGLWTKVKSLFVPMFANDLSSCLVEIKSSVDGNSLNKVTNSSSGISFDNGLKISAGSVVTKDGVTYNNFADGFCLFGKSSQGCVGTAYSSNNNRIGITGSNVQASYNNGGVSASVGAKIGLGGKVNVATMSSTFAKLYGDIDKEWTPAEGDKVTSFGMYLGFSFGQASGTDSTILYYGVLDSLTDSQANKLRTLLTEFESAVISANS